MIGPDQPVDRGQESQSYEAQLRADGSPGHTSPSQNTPQPTIPCYTQTKGTSVMSDLMTADQLMAEIDLDLADLIGEYDGRDTILIPNESTTYQYGLYTEAPSVVEFRSEVLKTFPTRCRFDLSLTSVALRITDTVERKGRIDFNAVGVGRRYLEVFAMDRWMDVGEYLTLLLKAANKNETRSTEQILASLFERGLTIHSEMPIFLQHLGADKDKFMDQLVPFMKANGAIDNTEQVNRNARSGQASQAPAAAGGQAASSAMGSAITEASYRFENSGLRLQAITTGRADRSKSQNHQGYLSPLDATFTTLMAIVGADKTITACKAILDDPSKSDQEKTLAMHLRNAVLAYWSSGMQRNRRPFHNWGGTTQGLNAQLPGAHTYWSTSVPMAEFVVLDRNGVEHEFNMWRRGTPSGSEAIVLPAGYEGTAQALAGQGITPPGIAIGDAQVAADAASTIAEQIAQQAKDAGLTHTSSLGENSATTEAEPNPSGDPSAVAGANPPTTEGIDEVQDHTETAEDDQGNPAQPF